MDKKQSEAKRLRWQNFWRSELGEEVLAMITARKDREMEAALFAAHEPCNGAAIQEHTIKAAGIDLVLQDIIATTQSTKNLN